MSAPKGNKYAIGNNGGRPPVFASPEALSDACNEYFIYIQGEFHTEKKKQKNPDSGRMKETDVKVWDRPSEPATVTGLALFLGFASRQSLLDYEKQEEYSGIIKRAKMRIEHSYERCLYEDKPTGAIFALKNMGWKDKSEHEVTVPQGLSVTYIAQPGNAPLNDEG